MSFLRIFLAVLAAGILFPATASAHMLWINASDFSPDPGQEVHVRIGWGHEYPRDQMINPDIIREVKVLAPDGTQTQAERIFPDLYRFTPTTQGMYQIIVQTEPGFVSKTPQGHKLGNKQELDNAVSCFRHRMNAKALIQAGSAEESISGRDDLALQLIPIEDPAELDPGDTLAVKALFKGEPQSGVTVKASSRDHEEPWISEQKTNQEGVVNFKVKEEGPWMFRAEYRKPYPDESVCDEYFYTSALNVGF